MISPVTLMLVMTAFPAAVLPQTIALPKPETNGAFPLDRALNERRSVREYSGHPIDLAAVSRLLWSAQGVTSRDGRRAAPSAGALYPLEITVVATRVHGLESGVYRYLPAAHALQRVGEPVSLDAIVHAAHGQEWISGTAAVFVIASVEGRTAKKYGARAGRYATFEAGAASENLLLQAVALGLGSCVVGAFDDAEIARLAGLASGEKPVVVLPVGNPR